jgi:hypothetical protein
VPELPNELIDAMQSIIFSNNFATSINYLRIDLSHAAQYTGNWKVILTDPISSIDGLKNEYTFSIKVNVIDLELIIPD